jgi:uncharacterized membrane protein
MSARTIWRWSGLLVVVTMIVSMAAATVSASPAPARLETTSAQQPSPVEAGKPTPQKQPSPTPTGPIGLTVSRPLRFSVSPPLRDLARIAPPPKAGPPRQIPLLPLPKALKGGGRGQPGAPLQNRHSLPQMPSPIVNFEGNSNADNQTVVGFPVQPPDTQGDVGPNHYIQWVNLVFSIYDKNGNRLLGPLPGNTLWASNPSFEACDTSNDGDPITLYDPLADRWLMSQFALPNFPYGPFYQCIAVSQTPDPLGSWYLYEYRIPVNKMNDYPKFGVWPDAYYMAVNQFNAGSLSWGGAGVAAFERSRMLVGDPAARMIYIDVGAVNLGYGGMLPADLDGPPFGNPPPPGAPGLFVEWDDSTWLGDPTDTLRIWEFRVNWTNPANSTFGANSNYDPNYMVPTMDVDPNMCGFSQNCIPQPGTANRLDAISDRLMYRLQYRNFGSYQTLASNHTVDADGTDHAGIHWFILRNSGAGWTMDQEGVYAPDSHHRWMGSFALDHMGNAALGYSISSSSVHPGIRYSGRLANDPSGTLPQGEAVLINGTGSQTGWSSRWGDYSMMSVDPADDCTFWYTQEYYAANGSTWQTRIGSFRFPNCSVGPTGTLTGRVYDSGTSAGIAGASVQAASSPTRTFSAVSDSNGYYTLTLPVGTYTVTASAYGYQFNSISGVEVLSGTITVRDIPLTPAPSYVVSGTVRDANTNWPLYARIRIDGYPGGPIWTDPVSGHYSVTLAGGLTYIFHISAWVNGYLSEDRSVGPLTGDRTEDFALQVDAEACNAPGYHLNCYYFQDFEADDGGFTTSGTNSSWAWGAPTSGPGAAHSGSNVWATNLAGDYNNDEDSYLESPDIDLSGLAGQTILLSWWQWLSTESGYDFASVEVSKDGGSTWTTVWGPTSGGTAQWEKITVLLDPSYAVSNFRVRFHLVADFLITYPGWYVDDLCIVGVPPPTSVYSQNFDSNNGGFATSGTNSSWAWGAPTSGPGAAHSGSNVWATNLAGDYNNDEDSYLESPDIDLSGLAGQTILLSWWQWLSTESGYDFASVEVSKDGGSTWTTVWGPTSGGTAQWEKITVLLDPSYAVSNFRVRFHLVADSSVTYPGWYVDDVAIATIALGAPPCVPDPGGLVVGNVYDANTGAGLTGARVANDSGYRTVALATPDDPNVGDAFYTLFSPAGSRVFTATVTRAGYQPDVKTVTVVQSDTVRQDFYLPAGFLDITPNSIAVTLTLGMSRTIPLTLTNSGGADAAFEIVEIDRGFQSMVRRTGPFAEPRALVPPEQQNARTTEGLDLPPAPSGTILAAGDVIQFWTPANNPSAWGLAYTSDKTVWVGEGWGENHIDEYAPDGTPTGRSWPYPWSPTYGPADDAFNWNTGMVWTLDVGGDNCLYEMDPAGGYTGNTICGPWAISQRGVAYDPATDTWYVGGWNEGIIYHIDSNGNLLDSAFVGLAIAGLAYNPDTQHLFVMVNDDPNPVYVLDASQPGYPQIGQFYVSQGFGAYAGAGLEFDCEGNLWAVDQGTNTVYQFESGETASLCAMDVPWLSEVPVSGTVTAGGSVLVNVTLDTGVIAQTGKYYATLRFKNNTPYGVLEVPVTMTVVVYGLALSPASASQSGRPGEVVTYTLTVTNTGNITDTFSVAVSGNTWTTRAPTTVGPLAAGTSATLQITVTIPANARAGASDTATVTLTSQGDATQSAQSSLTTTALAVYGLALSPASASQSGRPGEVVTYTLTVTNTGNITDTFSVAVSGNTWTTRAPTTVGPLAAGTSATLQITVTIPANARAGASDTATVTLTSQGDATQSAQSSLTTTALAVYGLALSPASASQSGRPGEVVTYTLTVTNTGNITDTFSVAVSGNTWTTRAPTTVGPLAAGTSATLQITVTIPTGVTGVDSDTATVTVTSQGDNSKTAQAALTTRRVLYRLFLPVVMRNYGP